MIDLTIPLIIAMSCVGILFCLIARQNSLMLRMSVEKDYTINDVIDWDYVEKEKERKKNLCVWGEEHNWITDYCNRRICTKCGKRLVPDKPMKSSVNQVNEKQ